MLNLKFDRLGFDMIEVNFVRSFIFYVIESCDESSVRDRDKTLEHGTTELPTARVIQVTVHGEREESVQEDDHQTVHKHHG